MSVAILHGYLLEGSGSNLWTRYFVESLARAGHDIHVICQDSHPENYPFVSEAYFYQTSDKKTEVFSRPRSQDIGSVVLHRPEIGETLPVYVWDKYESFEKVVPMINLSDSQIENYIDRNVEIIAEIVRRHTIRLLHANHLVLMPTVAERVSKITGVPYTVMLHGSAMEYAVKKDKRFFQYAKSAIRNSKKVFHTGQEIKKRLLEVFSEDTSFIKETESKARDVPLCVDTNSLILGKKKERREYINKLQAEHYSSFAEDQNDKKPDQKLKIELDNIDWQKEKILLYVGRLIREKGVASVLAAFPEINKNTPDSRLIISGHGPMRRDLELIVEHLCQGEVDQALTIIEEKKYGTFGTYLKQKENSGELGSYLSATKEAKNKILFTGYL